MPTRVPHWLTTAVLFTAPLTVVADDQAPAAAVPAPAAVSPANPAAAPVANPVAPNPAPAAVVPPPANPQVGPANPGTPNPPPGPAVAPPEIPADQIQVIRERGPDGSIQVESRIYKNAEGKDVLHGQWTMFRPDGMAIGGGGYVHGQRNGVWGRWFGKGYGFGNVVADPGFQEFEAPYFSEAHFVSGQLNGFWTIFDSKKRKMAEWSFQNGIQNGPWVWYFADGKKRHEAFYSAGNLHGAVIDYSPNGEVVDKTEYVTGSRKYPKIWWAPYDPTVKLVEGWYLGPYEQTKTTYDWWEGSARTVQLGVQGKDVVHGQWIWYHPNGTKAVVGLYHHGNQIGDWNWFNADGSLKQTKAFTPADLPVDPTAAAAAGVPPVGNPPQNAAGPAVAPPATGAPAPANGPGPSPAPALTPPKPAPAAVPAPGPGGVPVPAPTPAPAPAAVNPAPPTASVVAPEDDSSTVSAPAP